MVVFQNISANGVETDITFTIKLENLIKKQKNFYKIIVKLSIKKY